MTASSSPASSQDLADLDLPLDDAGRPHGLPDLVVPHAVLPFYLADAPVRGRLVRLGPLAEVILSRHSLPPAVLSLGAQALALVAAMATALKFNGSFSLQIKGDGPVSLLVADCTSEGVLRFTARMAENAPETLPPSAAELLGKGYLAFTVDQGPDTDRHQGIAELKGETLAEMAEHYFATSEQHACAIHLYACHEAENGWQAGALVLERIANDGGVAQNDDVPRTTRERDDSGEGEDLWETACTFADTLTDKEIFDPALSGPALVHRLFGTLDVRVAPARPLSFGCRCNRAKLANVLRNFSADDLDHMTQDGIITMDCHFCNTHHHFRRSALAAAQNGEGAQ
ncbi:Hsp33 family molecular chaperone HslO [Oecophyllibacter saccharovorans]|uniref:Hsp33 family molecular chaperone HslO n=1 Tax=Oecophyllibacter saccharovorans TaxID=2558360 RepID=A0A506UL72_9PROT|nr:Hsp33 family molecular chaperone HslO [Oecophyllibacter saccharovorans]TPW34104.1 Hsp33 family molecular chaperone HslO [Oecophyllibacter saccharovorans]TPW36286.1 Hsp33 family molecular chaperone HslO [Oecophyllibacter saccharovorans]